MSALDEVRRGRLRPGRVVRSRGPAFDPVQPGRVRHGGAPDPERRDVGTDRGAVEPDGRLDRRRKQRQDGPAAMRHRAMHHVGHRWSIRRAVGECLGVQDRRLLRRLT